MRSGDIITGLDRVARWIQGTAPLRTAGIGLLRKMALYSRALNPVDAVESQSDSEVSFVAC